MNSEQLIGLAGLTALLLGGVDWTLRLWFRRRGSGLVKTVDRLYVQVQELTEQLHARKAEALDMAEERDLARSELVRVKAESNGLRGERDELERSLLQSREGHGLLEKQRTALNNRVRHALKMEGMIWTQPPRGGTPPFRPLLQRRTPILSVLNLKGGVGKTTLAAYLAWALARQGYRVLTVDFDLQGSLSSLFLSERDLREREDGGLLLRHFLESSARDRKTKLLDYCTPTPVERVSLVGTTDRLAYAEMSLGFRWLLRVGQPVKNWSGRWDYRFLVRRGLHRKPVAHKFDVVLLDCPPLINLSCVNALAASDYVLIPVTCSRKATERVPPLLYRLQELKGAINPALRILGVVGNRTQSVDHFNGPELTLLNKMAQHAKDVWGEEVYRFGQPVPQRKEFRDAEDAFAPPAPGSDLSTVFDRLALELAGRLPDACRRSPQVPSQL